MKKIFGIIIMYIGCLLSAIQFFCMATGLTYGWGSILGGLVISVLSLLFLVNPDSDLLHSIVISAICIGVTFLFLLLCSGGRDNQQAANTPANNVTDRSNSSGYTYYPSDNNYRFNYGTYNKEKEPYSRVVCSWCKGSGICKECNGTGRNGLTGVLGAFGCQLCDRTGKCVKCGGDGYIEVY